MKSIIISPLYPPSAIYGSTDPNNLQLIVSGFTGTTYTVTGISDSTVAYTIKVEGHDCAPVEKTFQFSVTPTPTITPTNTHTPSASLPTLISWSPYDPYCVATISCPVGMTLSSDSRVCSGVVYTGATAPTSVLYVNNATDTNYSNIGARIYPVDGYNTQGDATAGFSYTVMTAAPLWKNGPGNRTDGRLNQVGVWVITGGTCNTNFIPLINTWIGFTVKVNVPTAKIYYVGMAGDNSIRFKVNDNVKVEQVNNADDAHFRNWHIYPIKLQDGINFISLEGINTGGPASFGAEIYDMTAAQLFAATSESDLNILFTTKNLFCQPIQTGAGVGYTCPAGWSLDMTTTPRCAMRVDQNPQSVNSGYKAWRYRRRLVNGVADGTAEENVNGIGSGPYFQPVVDTTYCAVGTLDPTPTVTPSITVSPSLTKTNTPTPTPSPTANSAYNTCVVVADEAVIQYVGGSMDGIDTLDINIIGMTGGYFGTHRIYNALYISSSTCRPCASFTLAVSFTNQTTGEIEIMQMVADDAYIRFEGYLDPAYKWDASFAIDRGCVGTGFCMLAGTSITMADGSKKNIENVQIGDLLMSLNIEGLLPEEQRTEEWYSKEFNGKPAITTVMRRSKYIANKIVRINRYLSTTPEHRHFIQREGTYFFEQAKNIREGDYLFNELGEFFYVNLVEQVKGTFDTYNIDVEDLDVYFASGFLTHNKAIPS